MFTPHIIKIRLSLRLRYPPSHKEPEEASYARKHIIDPSVPQRLVHGREELSDDKRRHPVRCQGPALRRTDGFRTDEFTREYKRDRAEAEGEADDKGDDGDGGEDW